MLMILALMAVLGLVLGSFVNALVWRLREPGLSIFKGRSLCPRCRHVLAPKDLVPLWSWVRLKGACRYCRHSISRQYPIVEAAVALLFVLSYALWPASLEGTEAIRFGFWLVFLTGFVALIVYDLKWMLLPHRIVYPLIGLAVLQWLAIWALEGLSGGNLRDIGLSAVVGGGLFYAIFQLSDGKWIGGGDVKLGFLLGLVVADPLLSWLMLFLAAFMGCLVTLPLMAMGKTGRQTRIPFGPFLIAACYLVVVFGSAILGWFERQALL